MCVVSMIGDHYGDKWKDLYPFPVIPVEPTSTPSNPSVFYELVSREEFEALKKEVLEMKQLLKKAIKYDQENNQPDCQKEEKLELLRRVAELVGVDLNDVLKEVK